MHPSMNLMRHRHTHPLEALPRDRTMSGGAMAVKENAETQTMTIYTVVTISQTMSTKWF